MWIVLLDHSGSMADSFRGTGAFSGWREVAASGTKLEAARQALYKRVRGLDAAENIVVIAFTTTASVVFDDIANQSAKLETDLGRLEGRRRYEYRGCVCGSRKVPAQADHHWHPRLISF